MPKQIRYQFGRDLEIIAKVSEQTIGCMPSQYEVDAAYRAAKYDLDEFFAVFL